MLCWHVVKVYSQKNRFSIQFLLFDTLSTKMYRKNRKLNKKKVLSNSVVLSSTSELHRENGRHKSTRFNSTNILCEFSWFLCGSGTAFHSEAPEFNPVLTCLSEVRGYHVVKLHVFTCLVPYCDVHYDLRVKTKFDSSCLPFFL